MTLILGESAKLRAGFIDYLNSKQLRAAGYGEGVILCLSRLRVYATVATIAKDRYGGGRALRFVCRPVRGAPLK